MSPTIKELSLTCDPVNEDNTFTNGDVLKGRVLLVVAKEANLKSFYIKCKGEADVSWSVRQNDRNHTYHSYERYFKLKQVFIQDPSKQEKNEPNIIITSGEIYGNLIKPGRHVFPFSFQMPHGNIPPSFKGCHGSIKYILEARLDRSWKLDKSARVEINFVPNTVAGSEIKVSQIPQSGAIDKKMKLFTSGSVSMRATIDKMCYMQGEVIKVSTNVDNSSSRELKLKYSLEQKQIFYAEGHINYTIKTIFKVVGDPIPKGTKATVNTDLIIPPNLEINIEHCSIIKLEYTFKVYLDVPYAGDPEIRFSVIILPAGQLCAPWQGQPSFPSYGPSPPPQAVFGPSPPPQAVFGPSPPPQAVFGPSLPGAASGPAPVQYPSLLYPQPSNPSVPPPSYTDVYPNQNSTFPRFQPAQSAPAFNPPPYSAMGYPCPSAPQQHPPSGPDVSPTPSATAYGQGASAPEFWPNSDYSAT